MAGPARTSKPGPALVSVVIPCYNQAHFLGEAIESVLAQSYPHLEIVVVDDGSPDNTEEVAARYPGVRYVRQENQGLAAARNTGLRHSRGDYLVFLDADDRLLPEAVEAGLEHLHAHPECAFAFGKWRLIAVDGSPLPKLPLPPIEVDRRRLRLPAAAQPYRDACHGGVPAGGVRGGWGVRPFAERLRRTTTCTCASPGSTRSVPTGRSWPSTGGTGAT